MVIKGLQDEDFVNYKKTAMFIGTAICDWKCCNEQCLDKSICQNSFLANSKSIDIPTEEIFRRYINNPISQAVVIGGLEPILQLSEVLELINTFRKHLCLDEFVIYTGYYPYEISYEINELKKYKNVIIKFGRFKLGQKKHYDEVLGVYLASDNQYAERIS